MLRPGGSNTDIQLMGDLTLPTGKVTMDTGTVGELTVASLKPAADDTIYLDGDLHMGGHLLTVNDFSVGTAEVVLDLEVGGNVEVTGDLLARNLAGQLVSTDTVAADVLTTKTGSNNKIVVQKGLDASGHKIQSTSAEIGTVFADNIYGLTYPLDPNNARTIYVQDELQVNKKTHIWKLQGIKDALGQQMPLFMSGDLMMTDSLSSWNDALGTKYKIYAHDIEMDVLSVNNIHSNNGNTVHVNSRVEMTSNLTLTSGNKLKTSSIAGLDNGGDIVVETPLNVTRIKVQELYPIDANHHTLYIDGFDWIDFGDTNITGTGGSGWPAGSGGGSGGFQKDQDGYLVDDHLNM